MFVDFHIAESLKCPPRVFIKNIYSLNADESYRVNHIPLEPNNYALFCTISGSGFLSAQGSLFTLSSRDAVLISPKTAFNYHCSGKSWRFFWFLISSSNPLPINVKMSLTDFMNLLIDNCFLHFKMGEYVLASSLFAALLELLIQTNHNEQSLSTIADARFYKADEYIRENIKDVTVTSLSEYLYVNPRTLYNIFTRCAGLSPVKYIMTVKLDTAQYLIKTTNKSINEISYMTGFSTQFYFSSQFKQAFSVSPSEYRRSINYKE